ncbi:hypothetical protein IKF92_01245 [Candidatus Saccharibacteria bacterium]|nr:hypothetical protein [Candidatus Saccharibacteria bacterium]
MDSSKKELADRLLVLWQTNHESYETLIPTYESLVEKLRTQNSGRRKRFPLLKIKKTDLKEYPDILLLKIHRESDATRYLLGLEQGEMIELINMIQDFLESYIYKTLINKIAEYKYQLDYPENPRCYAVVKDCYAKR